VIEEVCTFLAPLKRIRIRRIVSPLWALKIRGKTHPKIYPMTPKSLERIRPNFYTGPSMKLPTKVENMLKIDQGICL